MNPYTTEIDVRFRDIDAMDHVNNAVYATYLEQARAEYYRDVLDADLSALATVLASLSIDFRRPIELTDGAVAVAMDIAELGTSSVTMAYDVRTDDELVAEAETTLVSLDPDAGEPAPIPEEYRSAIESYHGM